MAQPPKGAVSCFQEKVRWVVAVVGLAGVLGGTNLRKRMAESDAQLVEYFNQLLVHCLSFAHCVDKWYVYHFVVTYSDHYVALPLYQGLDCAYPYLRGKDAVAGRGASAALQVAQDGYADVEVGVLFVHAFGVIHGTAFGAFAHDDYAAFLALADSALHELDELVAAG